MGKDFFEDFFGRIFWENFLGGFFCEEFFCEEFFGRDFLRGILWMEFFRRNLFVCQDFGFC